VRRQGLQLSRAFVELQVPNGVESDLVSEASDPCVWALAGPAALAAACGHLVAPDDLDALNIFNSLESSLHLSSGSVDTDRPRRRVAAMSEAIR